MRPSADAADAAKNRLLRHVDWRFLLPEPRPARTLCQAPPPLAEAVARISGEMVDPSEAPPGSCDLAVLADPSPAHLHAAYAALRPGGGLYAEWTGWRPNGPTGLRRALAGAGFSDLAVYWAYPAPERGTPLFWLPVEAPRALDYFLGTRPRAPTTLLRLRSALLRPVWQAARASGLLWPLRVVARKPPAAPAADLAAAVRAHWAEWGLGPAPRRLDWLLLTGGRRSLNKVIGLVFEAGGANPALIVKFAREPETAAALAQEAAVLRAVHAARPGGVRGAPRVVFAGAAGQSAIGETVLRGQPLYTLQNQQTHRALALEVTDWLAELAEGAVPTAGAEGWARIVEPALNTFAAQFSPLLQPGQLDTARAALRALPNLPSVPEQRDCSPWNVLRDAAGGLAVLDWESAEPRGLPGLDLIYFLAFWAIFKDGAMDNGRHVAAYRAALDPTTFTGSVTAECLARYAARTGLPVEAFRPLALLAWTIHARSDYARLADEAAGPPTVAALRSSLFADLWHVALEHVLAARPAEAAHLG